MIYNLLIPFSIILLTVSVVLWIYWHADKFKTKKTRITNNVCCVLCAVLGLGLLISLLAAPSEVVHKDCTAYEIELMTDEFVQYKVDDKINIMSSYRVEKANETYSNVFVKEENHFMRHWLWDLEYKNTTYVVYLDEEAWVLYESNGESSKGIIIDNSGAVQ